MPFKTGQQKRLLFAGALHVDDIAECQAPLIPQASNPVRFRQALGGVATNAAFAAARIASESMRIELAAVTGSDPLADRLDRTLRAADITACLQRQPGRSTGRYTAVMDHRGELYIGLADVSLAESFDPARLPLISASGPCHGLLVDANLSPDCLACLCDQAQAASIPVAAMTVSPAKAVRLLPVAASIDLLFVNQREAIALVDPDMPPWVSSDLLADGLQQLGFLQFVLTNGGRPVTVQTVAGRCQLPVPGVGPGVQPAVEECEPHAMQVNGAGDALAGGTFAAWCLGQALVEAVRQVGLDQAARVVGGETQAAGISLA